MADKEKLDKLVAEIERRYKEQNTLHTSYSCGRNDEDAELLSFYNSMRKEPKECMYSKDDYTDEDRKALCDGCEEECEFNKKEESINNGLDLGCGVIWKDEKSASGDLEKVVEEIVDPTVLNAYGVKEISNRLRRTMMDSVSEIDFEAEVKKLWMEINTGHSYSIVDSYNIFYGLCMDIADWQKEQQNIIEPTGEKQVKESLIFKHDDKTCKENGNSLTQEPVSEDLDFIATRKALAYVNNINRGESPWLDSDMELAYEDGMKAGANWQKHKDESKVLTEEQCRKIRDDAFELGKDAMKQQMERYRIEHCKSLTNEQAELEDNFVSSHVEKNNRIPTFIDAIEYGMEYCKQQMMAKAVGATVHIDAGGYPYIPQMELYDYEKDIPFAKEGDKYKVILIKE